MNEKSLAIPFVFHWRARFDKDSRFLSELPPSRNLHQGCDHALLVGDIRRIAREIGHFETKPPSPWWGLYRTF
jgi:hypothetical protein